MHSLLVELLLFCSAAVILVPLFKYLNLGPVLAYLFAGLLIGPEIFAFVKDPDVILHFSELGIVFLLFIIGLELAPAKLWKLRSAIFGLGLSQVAVTGALFFVIAKLLGLNNATAYVAGFGLALSSTAFALQILEENRQLNTTHGQGSFSVLMFQDIVIVPLLASLSLFGQAQGSNFGFINIGIAIGFIVVLIGAGPYIVRHFLRLIASSEIPEVFTAASLLLVLGTALAAEQVGLSMGMGAFIAGVLLANSEYRHELEVNLLPFKGLLLGLFFIAVGMSLDLQLVLQKPHLVLLLTGGFCILKMIVLYMLSRAFRYPKESARNIAFTIFQGGEFAFVLFSAALASRIIDAEIASLLTAAVIFSMLVTPALFNFNQKKLRRSSEISERPYDKIDTEHADVIVAGYGRFGQIVTRFLNAEKIPYLILEHSAAQVEIARKFGAKVYYGDASSAEILASAKAKDAKIFVLAIDDPEKSIECAKVVKKKYPHLKIIARVRNRRHAHDLMKLGIENIHRETYLTSLQVAKEVLLEKGLKEDLIDKKIALFKHHDEKILKKQFEHMDDEKKFISYTVAANQQLYDTLRADQDS